jgi:uncharacterized protein (TIGR02271 family)
MTSRARTAFPLPSAASHGEPDVHVPVVEETAHVQRAAAVTGCVRVRKRVSARVMPVDVELARERVHVTRHRVEREVDAAPPVRREGDTLIIPVVEERVVVERRLVVREEIHVTRVRTTSHARKRVRLRAEHVEVERIDDDGASDGGASAPPRPRRERA